MHPDDAGEDSDWHGLGMTALEMFAEAGVQFHAKTPKRRTKRPQLDTPTNGERAESDARTIQ